MRQFLFPLVLIASLFGAQAASADDGADRSHPVLAATDFLKAFAARDATQMAATSNPEHHEMLAEIVEKGEAARAYREIFGGWRHEAAVTWDGNFLEARTKTFAGGKTYVMLPYHDSGQGWIAVLMLSKDDGGWFIDDIEKWQLEDYRREPLATL